MVRIRRRARKIFKLVMGDGKTFTILDWEKDEQSGKDVFHVKGGGAGFLLALGATVVGAAIGYIIGQPSGNGNMYAFFGAFASFVGSMLGVVFLHIGSTLKKIMVPAGAVMWPGNNAMVSGRSTAIFIPNYNRYGQAIDNITSPVAQLMKQSEFQESFIKSLQDQIKTLYYNLKDTQKTPKEMLDDMAQGLEKLGRAAAQFKPSVADRLNQLPQQPNIVKDPDEVR